MSTIEQAEEWLKEMPNGSYCETSDANKVIRALVDELKESKSENMDHALSLEIIGGTAESNAELKRQRDVMREALRYYADESNYYYNPRPCIPVIDDDGGERARQAIKDTTHEMQDGGI